MRSRTSQRRSGCPISFTLDTLGDKWALLIVRDLMFLGKRNFGEFLDSGEGIATNILSDRLKRLEREGIVSKERDPENGKRFVYSLSPKGTSLLPLLLEMVLWGAEHDPKTDTPQKFVRRVKRDRDAVMREILERVKRQGRGSWPDVVS